MKLMSSFVLILALASFGAKAECNNTFKAQENFPYVTQACSELNLREVPICTSCYTKEQVNFQLYARDSDGSEVWYDFRSGALWGSRLSKDSSKHDADQACSEYSKAVATGNLQNAKFSLPSKEDFETAEAHGLREVVQPHHNFFWTSSIDPVNSDYALVFSGGHGYIYANTLSYPYNSVRCIGH